MFMAGLALKSFEHIRFVGPVSFFPIAALLIMPIAAVSGAYLRPRLESASTHSAFAAAAASPIVILALVPTFSIFIVSMLKPMVASRALLIFVPYFLLVVAAGLGSLRRIALAVPAGLAMAAFFAVSIVHFRSMPSSLRDYQGLAQAIEARLQPEDLIFVTARDWQMTPIFYYLDKSRLVARNYAEAVEGRGNRRVWVVIFDRTKTKEMLRALNQFTLAQEVAAFNGRARLYTRNDTAD